MASSSTEQLSNAELEKKWGGSIDTENSSTAERDLYLKFKLWQYFQAPLALKDHDLWEQYREDFANWTLEHFRAAKQHSTRTLRALLRTNGVWVSKSPNLKLPDALYATIQDNNWHEWTQAEINDHLQLQGTFESPRMTHLLSSQPTNSLSTIDTSTTTLLTPQSMSRDPARDITNLVKLYSSEEKYSGEGDSFETSLTSFNNYCSQISLSDDKIKAKAYSVMLKGPALRHFYQPPQPQ